MSLVPRSKYEMKSTTLMVMQLILIVYSLCEHLHNCSSWGDAGYFNRWTLEVTSLSSYSICLGVGRRIGQIVFYDTIGTLAGRSYGNDGKYQSEADLAQLVANWTPLACLPKMYLDREIGKAGAPQRLPAAAPTTSQLRYAGAALTRGDTDGPVGGVTTTLAADAEVDPNGWYLDGAAVAAKMLAEDGAKVRAQEEQKQKQ